MCGLRSRGERKGGRARGRNSGAKDGKDTWSATLEVRSVTWTTSSRRQVKAGAWTVDVVAADGTTLGTVRFTVQQARAPGRGSG